VCSSDLGSLSNRPQHQSSTQCAGTRCEITIQDDQSEITTKGESLPKQTIDKGEFVLLRGTEITTATSKRKVSNFYLDLFNTDPRQIIQNILLQDQYFLLSTINLFYYYHFSFSLWQSFLL
jgi:hypothetical protein